MTTRARLRAALVRAYPPSFRGRYGGELAAVAADTDRGWRDHVDLARGALRAWAVPAFGGDPAERRRARLEATTLTVLAAWSASLLAAATFSKAVDDPRLPGLRGVAWDAGRTANGVAVVLGAVVLATGLATWLVLTVPAVRARRRDVVVPAAAPAAVVVLWLGVTALVGLFARHVSVRGSVALTGPGGALVLGVLAAWAALTLVCAAACVGAAGLALHRAALSAPRLARTTLVAALATAGIAVQAAAAAYCLAGLFGPHAGLDPYDAVLATGAVVVQVGAAMTASVSAGRGIRSLRAELPSGPGTVA